MRPELFVGGNGSSPAWRGPCVISGREGTVTGQECRCEHVPGGVIACSKPPLLCSPIMSKTKKVEFFVCSCQNRA